MAVGVPATKADVNQALGICARAYFHAGDVTRQFKSWLDTQTDQNLIDLGFTSGEVAVVRSAMTDLDHLRGVFEGANTRTPAYDYRTFAKLAIGVGIF